jgi:4-aminobutyrate aminotransferase
MAEGIRIISEAIEEVAAGEDPPETPTKGQAPE